MLIRRTIVLTVFGLMLGGIASLSSFSRAVDGQCEKSNAASEEGIDFQKARGLMRKERAGEKLTPEEQEFVKRARAERRKGDKASKGPAKESTGEGRGSVGIKPLTEMRGDERYKGEEGGLYGAGKNEPPAEHLQAALAESAKIEPLDAAGKLAANGKIVLLAIGMSNTTHEFSSFKTTVDADPQKSAHLVLVDGAQGGQAAKEWTDAQSDKIWSRADARLTQAGVTPAQVQAIWLKQAIKRPLRDATENARVLHEQLITILNLAKTRYPNLRIAYLSSRSYGGHSEKHGEPESFETALAVRWTIQKQIGGDSRLNFDAGKAKVQAPVILWGPYLWADGTTPRTSDGLSWTRSDFVDDGTHPSESGRKKAVDLLLKFFEGDPTAKRWFVKR